MAKKKNIKRKSYREWLEDTSIDPTRKEPRWLLLWRKRALQRFREDGVPSRGHEAWRYLNLETLLGQSFVKPLTAPDVKVPSKFLEARNRLVFVNGHFRYPLSTAEAMPAGVTFGSLMDNLEAAEPFFQEPAPADSNPFTLINAFAFNCGVLLHIPKGLVVEEPIHLVFITAPDEFQAPAVYPRLLITLEEGSSAEVVIHQAGVQAGPIHLNTTALIQLGAQARLHAALLQTEEEGAVNFFTARARLAAGSSLDLLAFTDDGSVTRNDIKADLEGARASFVFNGLNVLTGASQSFCHILANHTVPDTQSRQVVRNILGGHSVAEFNSMVHVWRGADRSHSEQLDKNMLLSDQARVYSRPQLRIDADDVKASHGAATGHTEENELFYLRSRGLSEWTARFLIIFGFAEEILELVKLVSLRRRLEEMVKAQLQAMLKGLEALAETK